MRFHNVAITALAAAVFCPAGGCSQAVLPVSGRASVTQPMTTSATGTVNRALQLVVFVAPDWNTTSGSLRRFERPSAEAPWTPVGAVVPAVVGRTGLAWSDSALVSGGGQPVKHEGDGKSPAGVFPLDTTFGFASRPEMSWLRMPYVPLGPGSDCVDDVASVHYNTVVDRSSMARVDWTSAEHMREVTPYRIGVIVGYNAPPQSGRGSCIFLHIWGGPASSTAGCTALDAGKLEELMRWLDSSRHPAIVQLPSAEYARLRAAWRLPAL